VILEVFEHADAESKETIKTMLMQVKKKLAKAKHAGAKVLLKHLN
jgi:hypothetical protein